MRIELCSAAMIMSLTSVSFAQSKQWPPSPPIPSVLEQLKKFPEREIESTCTGTLVKGDYGFAIINPEYECSIHTRGFESEAMKPCNVGEKCRVIGISGPEYWATGPRWSRWPVHEILRLIRVEPAK